MTVGLSSDVQATLGLMILVVFLALFIARERLDSRLLRSEGASMGEDVNDFGSREGDSTARRIVINFALRYAPLLMSFFGIYLVVQGIFRMALGS